MDTTRHPSFISFKDINMISIKKSMEILNKGDKQYSLEEALKIRQFCYDLAQIEYRIRTTIPKENLKNIT